jgi:hypothetical protein
VVVECSILVKLVVREGVSAKVGSSWGEKVITPKKKEKKKKKREPMLIYRWSFIEIKLWEKILVWFRKILFLESTNYNRDIFVLCCRCGSCTIIDFSIG